MYRYHALGGASLLVLGSALALVPSTAEAQTALPAVTVEAPRGTAARPAARKPAVRSSARTQARPPSANPAPSASLTAGITPSVARALLYQAPTGQTETTIDRSQFDNRPAFSVADVLRESPGISVKQGNGPRDIGISIRGSNARNGFGIRNIVIFDDGFPVTQPDGLSRSDLIDPRAYGAIDVIRGPSSALYGNYATGGALNFRTRPGRTIDGVEYGVDGGSFGYLNNYLAAGKKVGNFEYSLFASDARGDGFIQNSWFNTQTVNFLGTLHVTPDDRFTVKFINNNLETRLPIRLSLNQYNQNPFQRDASSPASPAADRSALLNNGFNGARTPTTAMQAGLGREDRRTIVGGRWEHDFDNTTTWRNQFVFDDRNISQPTGATSAIGDFPSYNYMSDITKRGEIFGMDSTTYFGAFYNTLTASSDTRNVMPGGNARLGLLQSNTFSDTSNYGVRAREELKLHPNLTAIAGIGWETTILRGVNTAYAYPDAAMSRRRRPESDIRRPAISEHRAGIGAALQARIPSGSSVDASPPDTVRRRSATCSCSRRAPRQQHATEDAEKPRLRPRLRLDAEQRADVQRDRLLRILQERTGDRRPHRSTPRMRASPSTPRSPNIAGSNWPLTGSSIPAGGSRRPIPISIEIYTEYTENLDHRRRTFSFNRAGNKIPGISPNELTARLGYDQMWGPLAGLGAFVEVQWKNSFYMDNANLLKAPGYELVNLNVHYNTDLKSDYFKSLSMYAEVRNVFDRTYVASANNIANTVHGRRHPESRQTYWRAPPARSTPARRARSWRE